MIKLALPDIQRADIQRAVAVLESGSLIQGEQVKEFEKRISKFLNVNDCAVVSSCTAALHLALKALGVKNGDTVIAPAFTFPATTNVVENLGAEVLLCDVEVDNYLIKPERLEALIELYHHKNIKAIIIVHAFGCPVEMSQVSTLARKYQIKLIEDAACALGTIADGYPVGYYSDLACLSFHPRKALTTGEGGAVVSKSESTIQQIKLLRNHGIQYDDDKIDFILDGLNYRMTEFQAALALGQIDRFEGTLAYRKKLVDHYFYCLANQSGITLPRSPEGHSWQSFMIVLDNHINRDKLIKKLLNENIQTNLGAQALNCLTYYQQKYGMEPFTYPNATHLYKQGLVLPLHGGLNERDIEYICERLIQYL